MHMIIRNIVYANSEKQALSKAKENFEQLCDGQEPFDYYDTFDEGGSSRWGEKYPAVANIKSRLGRKMVVDGYMATLRDIKHHLNRVRKTINSCKVTELLEGDLTQYDFYAIGEYQGSSCWLYDNDACGIKRRSHLNSALDRWEALYKNHHNFKDDEWKYKDLDVYVVPADVHY